LPKDELEAARLYKLAGDQGLVAAQYNLGVLY
jgi:TPR repeat protein